MLLCRQNAVGSMAHFGDVNASMNSSSGSQGHLLVAPDSSTTPPPRVRQSLVSAALRITHVLTQRSNYQGF